MTGKPVGSGQPGPQRLRRLGAKLEPADYRMLSQFRYLLRCFLEFSQHAARDVGLTTRQHQALLAIKGFSHDEPPTVGDLAERLRIRHHSAVELVDRLVESGLVAREPDADDRRRVRLGLTGAAEERLADLSATHLDELLRMRPALQEILWLLSDQARVALPTSPSPTPPPRDDICH